MDRADARHKEERIKARIIREGLDLMPFHPDWSLPSRMDRNPLVWMLEVNGLIMDIRMAPREAQVAACNLASFLRRLALRRESVTGRWRRCVRSW